MEIMQNYADLKRKIDIIARQIEMYEVELEYWWFTEDNKPGKGLIHYGLSTASERTDKKLEKLNTLKKMHEFYKDIKEEIDDAINGLEGLPYKIAYRRFIQNMNYDEIAEDLGYTPGYIRQVASKTNKQRTEMTKKA